MKPFTQPSLLLRAEGLVCLAAGCMAYQRFWPGHWGLFAALFLAPDLSILAYLGKDKKLAATCYNALHSYLGPVALALAFWPVAGPYALIWICHIGFDRLMGYGLKFPSAFGFTHIQSAAQEIAHESAVARG